VSEDFNEANAKALAEMLADPSTPENIKLNIINELLADKKDETFFETIFEEALSQGLCPFCQHKNHWVIPEDDLNTMGHVTSEKDKRVKIHTTKDDCPEFQESCGKKKLNA
jgi:hypothetical protein